MHYLQVIFTKISWHSPVDVYDAVHLVNHAFDKAEGHRLHDEQLDVAFVDQAAL